MGVCIPSLLHPTPLLKSLKAHSHANEREAAFQRHH